jgi:hypothetical protein
MWLFDLNVESNNHCNRRTSELRKVSVNFMFRKTLRRCVGEKIRDFDSDQQNLSAIFALQRKKGRSQLYVLNMFS